MFYIHGGGYFGGNGYQGYYGGLPLSGIGDVILVTINYRLNALGFLTTGMGLTSVCTSDYLSHLQRVPINIVHGKIPYFLESG